MLLHDLTVLPSGDLTNVGSKGLTLSGGQKSRVCIARALYLDSRFLVFDDIFSGLDADTEEQVFRAVFSPTGLLRRRNATAVLCTHSVKHLPSADHIVALGSDGRIVEQGPFLDLMTNDSGYVYSLGVKESGSEKSDDDITLASSNSPIIPQKRLAVVEAETAALTPKEEPERALGDSTVFRHYFARVNMWVTMAMVICSIGWGFFNNFNVIWLKFWSQDVESANPRHSTPFYLGLYAFFQITSLICLFVDCLAVLVATTRIAGARIHKEALATVINAPLRFFTTTDTGVVTNHFSQDMTLIDGSLPMSFLNTSVIIATCIGVAAVIATSSQFLIISYPFLAALLWGIQKFYLRTSRQIRLLDLEAKSPL
jgi:ATP-binding cassette subfamily C (CFTR/MRP) protein 1